MLSEDDFINIFFLESIFNTGVNEGPRRAAAGIRNLDTMTSKKILNLASSCFGGGFFQPLFDPSELSDRELRMIEQTQFLILHFNSGRGALSRNWANEINYNLTRQNLIDRRNFFEKYTNENFSSDPDFLFKSKSIPEMEIFVRKMNFQISDLLENSFFLRFLYKFSNADNAENVADKDQMLEELTGFSNAYEDIYMGKLLDSIRNCLSSKYFCGLCLKTFKKTEEILPHMSAFHKSFVSNESVEELRNSRDARRRQESEDQMRTRHNNNHPQCQTCFVSPE